MTTVQTVVTGDARRMLSALPKKFVHCCVTSPPYYGLRDYGVAGQMGLEPTLAEYIAGMVGVFREVRRALRDDGTLWLNIGDSYNAAGRIGHGTRVGYKQGTNRASDTGTDHVRASCDVLKPKDLLMVPARLAIALQDDGWYLRSDIIWHKPNPMPESVTDRPTAAHEHVFLLTKSARYFYDAAAVREDEVCGRMRGPATHPDIISTNGNAGLSRRESNGTRNLRNVWTIAPKPFKGAHFATFPPDLAGRCIKAGSPEGGLVLDPFGGAGTTGLAAKTLNRNCLLFELNPEYVEMARRRIDSAQPEDDYV